MNQLSNAAHHGQSHAIQRKSTHVLRIWIPILGIMNHSYHSWREPPDIVQRSVKIILPLASKRRLCKMCGLLAGSGIDLRITSRSNVQAAKWSIRLAIRLVLQRGDNDWDAAEHAQVQWQRHRLQALFIPHAA